MTVKTQLDGLVGPGANVNLPDYFLKQESEPLTMRAEYLLSIGITRKNASNSTQLGAGFDDIYWGS